MDDLLVVVVVVVGGGAVVVAAEVVERARWLLSYRCKDEVCFVQKKSEF